MDRGAKWEACFRSLKDSPQMVDNGMRVRGGVGARVVLRPSGLSARVPVGADLGSLSNAETQVETDGRPEGQSVQS